MPTVASPPVFALLAGGGTLPATLLGAAQHRGWPCHVFTFAGQPQPEGLPAGLLSRQQFGLGAIGAILKSLQQLKVTHVALAGHLNKPSLFTLKLDARGVLLLTRLLKEKNFHDDAILRTITTLLAEEGYQVVGVAELMPGLLAPKPATGTLMALGKVKPAGADVKDLALALAALEPLGRLDIGQGVVVHNQTILGLEAVEGTDALLLRCAPLRGNSGAGAASAAPQKRAGLLSSAGAGLLVKVAKPGQTEQADLPTIGPATLQLLHTHGYRGVIVQAEKTLLLGQPELTAYANRHGLLLATTTVPW